MPLVGGTTSICNASLTAQLGCGIVTISWEWFRFFYWFHSANGAVRSPDASWLKRERWDALTQEQKERFAPVCPDFVVELRSDTDCLKRLQEKMREYRS
jgi:Uma2 family endonuclease